MISIKGIHAGYGLVKVLRDVSLDIASGEIVAVLGSNGVGKTTLNNTLSGLITPTAGEIYFEDELISGRSPADIVDMGLIHVPEGRKLFPNLTVKDNLELGSYRRGKPNRSANFDTVLEIFPRLKDRLMQSAGTLSGGEQQMLAVGRALVTNPRLLLLDEPLEGLAPIIVEELLKAISRLTREEGLSAIIVEQHPQAILAISDQAIVLDQGQVVYSSSAESLLQQPDVLAKLLGVTKSSFQGD